MKPAIAPRHRNLHGHVLEQLGRQIASGGLAPGSALPAEPILAETFSVSRIVIREVVKSLVAKGMVSVGPSVGTRILPRSRWRLLDPEVLQWQSGGTIDESFVSDLIELRAIIEPQAARLAAMRANAQDLAAIRAAFDAMTLGAEDPEAYSRADLAFHSAVLAASHNQFLRQLDSALAQILRLNFTFTSRHPGALASGLPAHRKLLAAIQARDAEGAARAVETLIARNQRFLKELMPGTSRKA